MNYFYMCNVYTMSIFELATSKSQLASANSGMSSLHNRQVSAQRDVSGGSFSEGLINFNWDLGGSKYWLPSRTMLRIRYTLSTLAGVQLTNASDAAPAMNLASGLFTNAEFRINDKVISRVADYLPQISTLKTRQTKSRSHIESIADASNFWSPDFLARRNQVASNGAVVNVGALATDVATDPESSQVVLKNTRRTKTGELSYCPPLAIFDYPGALPAGSYSLSLTPANRAALYSNVIESVTAEATAADFKFTVDSIYLDVATVNGPRVSDKDYYLDLRQIRCQSIDVAAGFTQKNFTVSPATQKLTIAYQHSAAGSNSRFIPQKFKTADSGELGLSRLFLQYADMSYPSPDAAPAYNAGTGVDQITARYIDTMVNNASYWDAGGAETLDEWQDRGAYYTFNTPRDADNRDTRVSVHSADAGGDDVNMLLFDEASQIARVQVVDGRVVDVYVEDA